MITFNSIRKHFTNKTVVHLAMLAFAVTSTLNVAGFFAAMHHHWLVAASIGLALGAGLMAVSVYLSAQDTSNKANFYMLLAAAICMATLSGQIQSMAYRLHGLDTFTSYLLGYAPPFVVEILLALSVSLAERNEQERVQRDSKGHIKNSVATAMTTAFRDVDASRIQKRIERQVDTVIQAFVDDALGEMMAELNGNRHPMQAPQTGTIDDAGTTGNTAPQNGNRDRDASALPASTETETGDDSDRQNGEISGNLERMNEKRRAVAIARRQQIRQLLTSYGALSVAEIVEKLQADCNTVASERTVRTDCNALVETGTAFKDGAKFTAIAALPAAPVPVLNGHAHD